MTSVHLLDNSAFTWNGDTQPFAQTRGTAFSVSVATTVTALRWYRQSTGVNRTPSRLDLWDLLTGTSVAGSSSPADSGSVGWQETTLGSPVSLVANRSYAVTGDWATSDLVAHIGQTSIPTPPSPLTVPPNFRCYSASGTHGVPITFDNSNIFNVDVAVDGSSTNPPGGGATSGDVDASLAAWLRDDSDNSHKDTSGTPGLPWTTKQHVDDVRTLAQGATGFDAIKAVADAVAAVVSGLPGTIASAVTTITGQLTTMTGNISQTGIATVGSITHDLLAFYNHNLDVLAGHATTGGSTPNFVWTAGTAVDVDGAKFLAVPADAYLLTIMTPPTGLPLNDYDGVHVYFRTGWWCECIDGVGSERHYVDFEQTWLRDGTRRLGGCLVLLGPGGFGQLTPYTLEPA